MDTDDLSKEAYEGILIEAEKLTHDLTLHYGLLSYNCINETDYIEKAEQLTKRIIKLEEYELDDFFWGNPPNKERLYSTLKKIIANIEKVKTIQLEKRKFDF
jgi:hypothetical protein